MASGQPVWATTLVALPSQVTLILTKGNLIYENQCFVFRDLVSSVAQYAALWIEQFPYEILTAAAVGEELIRVLKRGMEFVTFCADKTFPGVIFIILGSLGELREIIDDVRRYSQMVNHLISHLIQFAKAENKVELIDEVKSKVESDCKALHTSLEEAFEKDKLAFSTLEKAFNEDNLPSSTTLSASTFKWISGIFTGSSEKAALNRFCSMLQKGVLPTIDIKNLSISARLGNGNFGEVKKALWCGTMAVAIKKFHVWKDFEDELNVYRKMTAGDSAHIVQILGHYHTEKIVGKEKVNKGHLVLELMDRNLDTVIGENEVTIMQSVDILLQIAKAMKCMHAKDIIYRDLKPANILLNRNEDKSFHIKLADFGISKTDFETLGSHTERRGTPMQMAPEILRGEKSYSRKVDTYSFGVVCSQIVTSTLTSTLNSQLKQNQDVLKQVEAIRGELKRKSLEKGIPERLKSLIVGCWEEDDNKRPNFEQICEELWVIKENLLIEEAAIKELGIDKDNYYNIAVCGATRVGKSSFIDAFLRLKGSDAAGNNRKIVIKRPGNAVGSTRNIKRYINTKHRPRVALWKIPDEDYSAENYFVGNKLHVFDCILILTEYNHRSGMFLEADKQVANQARIRNMKVAVICTYQPVMCCAIALAVAVSDSPFAMFMGVLGALAVVVAALAVVSAFAMFMGARQVVRRRREVAQKFCEQMPPHIPLFIISSLVSVTNMDDTRVNPISIANYLKSRDIARITRFIVDNMKSKFY